MKPLVKPLDSDAAIQMVDDAIAAEIVGKDKRRPLLLLGRHHGIDGLRDAIACIASMRLSDEQLGILRACGVSVHQYIRSKAQNKRGQ